MTRNDSYAVGKRVKISMGVNSGKIACIILMNRIKTDGLGVPNIDKGHYRPITKTDRAIQYEVGGDLDVQSITNLIPIDHAEPVN